jgi:serine/threonine protein phosphatase 1
MTKTPVYYAIGDIHGDLEQLLLIHNRIEEDRKTNNVTDYQIVHVGDLVDRRPDSKGVIDFLMQGIAANEPWTVLKGNHDRLFQWFMETPHRADDRLRPDYNWLHHRMGGRETLESYGITFPTEDYDIDAVHAEALKIVPQSHYDFIKDLPLMLDIGEFIIVHAGINPTRPIDDQDESDLLWIRPGFLDYKEPFVKKIIHGHTSIDEVTDYGNRINIDTGAAWGKAMSAVVIEGSVVQQLTETGRGPLAEPEEE